MLCKWCKSNPAKKTFCSHDCRNQWTRFNNLNNNPIHNPIALEKMKQSLTGKKHSEETKLKRSGSLKLYYDSHPLAKSRLAENVWEKYTKNIPPGWQKMRQKALERDNYTCQGCGVRDRRLVIHHLDYRGKNLKSEKHMNNNLSNLITWCDKCHNGFHRHKSKDYHERMAKLAP